MSTRRWPASARFKEISIAIRLYLLTRSEFLWDYVLAMTNNESERSLDEQTNKMSNKVDEIIGGLKMIRKEKGAFWQAQFERLVERVERLERHAGLQPLPAVL